MLIQIASGEHNPPLSSTVVDLVEGVPSQEQPTITLDLPFASGKSSHVEVILSNGAAQPLARIGRIEIFELGATSYRWTRYPRFIIHHLQRFFLTAWILPLVLGGVVSLLRARRWQTLTLLLIVPVYYLCAQSALHTERRYVIAIHYFLFVLAAVFLHSVAGIFRQRWKRISVIAFGEGNRGG